MINRKLSFSGFTLTEILVGSAVFLIVAIAAYNAYIGLFKLIDLSQYRVLAAALANEQFEIARNMPYGDVGVVGSIPAGKIPHIQTINRGGVVYTVTTIVRNIDIPFDGTIGGSPNDLSPADNKLVEITIACATPDGCRGMQPFTLTGQVAPKNLETASTNGALFIRVFDANGQPVKDANINVTHVATTTTIVINDVTDANGMLQLVDLPPGGNAYRITATKPGYSGDRTYPIGGAGNPDPSKPDATVLLQQVTQVSFAIDKLSTLNAFSVTPSCSPVPSVDFTLAGSKTIGSGVLKYSQNLATNGAGELSLAEMEWDTYTVTGADASHDVIGLNPLNPVAVNPDTTQNVRLIVSPKNPRSLLITVKDSTTGLPLSDATVNLTGPGGYDSTKTTGRGFLSQTDWSGGPGQALFINPASYWTDDANVDVSTSSGQILLGQTFGSYNPSGLLESSHFDSGSPSNFYSLLWSPTDQPALAGPESVRFQLASNATVTPTTTWAFKGPDGTAGTFYTVSDSPISDAHANDRFIRYRAYLSTQTATVTPNVSDVSVTYTSDCVPPGQVIFSGLGSGQYSMSVSKPGYAAYVADVTMSANWVERQVILGP